MAWNYATEWSNSIIFPALLATLFATGAANVNSTAIAPKNDTRDPK